MKVVFIALVLSIYAMATDAANVTVVASGAMTEFLDPDSVLPFAEPSTGTIFFLTFTYDDSTVDFTKVLDPSDLNPSFGLYRDPISSMSLNIGSQQYVLGSESQIIIFDNTLNAAGSIVDLWAAEAIVGSSSFAETFGLSLVATGDSAPIPVLSSDELVEPFWPGAWGSSTIRYEIQEEVAPSEWVTRALASADIESFSVTTVPIPAAAWLFGSALGLFGWIRRKTV